MRKVLEECPTCGGELLVTELSCTECETIVHGRYQPCLFCRLPAEDVAFLELFVRARGNVKEMERDLGLSYWTIRNRLNELVDGLEAVQPPPAPAGATTPVQQPAPNAAAQRQEVLERLDRGELSVAEAAALLTALK